MSFRLMRVYRRLAGQVACLAVSVVLPSFFADVRAELTAVLPIRLEGLPSENFYVLPKCEIRGETGRSLQHYGERSRWNEWSPLRTYPVGRGRFDEALEINLGVVRYEYIEGLASRDGMLLSAMGEGGPASVVCSIELFLKDGSGYSEFVSRRYFHDRQVWFGDEYRCPAGVSDISRSNCARREGGSGLRMYPAKGAPPRLIVAKRLTNRELELLNLAGPGSVIPGSCPCGCGAAAPSRAGCRSPLPSDRAALGLSPVRSGASTWIHSEKCKLNTVSTQNDQLRLSAGTHQQLDASRPATRATAQILGVSASPKIIRDQECALLDQIFYRGTGKIDSSP